MICLQETHIKRSDKKYLIRKKLGEEFYSVLDKKKRGTWIYAKKELNPKKILADDNSRYIAIEITYREKKILLLNVYAPNGSKTAFFQEVQKHLNILTYEHLLIIGDFNGTINNELDRSGTHNTKKKKAIEWKVAQHIFQSHK